MDNFYCSKCCTTKPRFEFHEADNSRLVQIWCIECAKKYRFQNKHPQCPSCQTHRKLNSNGICKFCNAIQGLKECRGCHELILLNTGFYKSRGTCIECRLKANRDYQTRLKDLPN